MMKTCALGIVAISMVAMLSGCETVARSVLKEASDSDGRSGSSYCQNLSMRCPVADYREWETAGGQVSCSCAN